MAPATVNPWAVYSTAAGSDLTDFKLVAVTRTQVVDLTDSVISLEWSETLGTAARSGSVTLFREKPATLTDITKGSRLILYFRNPYGDRLGKLTELDRFVVWSRVKLADGSIQLTFQDLMVYPNTSTDEFLFQKDAKHASGWTATEITLWAAKKYQIPLGKVVASKFRLPYLHLQESSIYELLLKVWSWDSRLSRRRYIIQSQHDKLYVYPKQSPTVMWELSDDTNMLDLTASFTDSLENMFTAVTVSSTNSDSTATKTSTKAPIRVTVQNKQKADQFGYLHTLVALQGLPDKATALRVARNVLLADLKGNYDATVTVLGIPQLRAGHPIHVVQSDTGLNGQFWVESVHHTLTSGSFTSTVQLNWMDVVPTQYPDSTELYPASAGYSGSGAAAGTFLSLLRTQKGVPYAWGGGDSSGPTTGSISPTGKNDSNTVGFDCSGLMEWGFAQLGITMPHFTDALAQKGQTVPVGQEQPGDLVFYTGGAQKGATYTHVAAYVDADTVIEAVRPVVREGSHPGWVAVRRYASITRSLQKSATAGAAGGTYPGDNASMATRARWMGAWAQSLGVPPLLPVMASIPENGIKMGGKPGDGGKAVGFFQVWATRAEGWNSSTAADRSDPQWQIKWFCSEAKRLDRGYSQRGESAYAAWCQAIEASADSSGSKYKAAMAQAKSLLGIA